MGLRQERNRDRHASQPRWTFSHQRHVGRPGHGYAGCASGFPWPDRVHQIPVERIPSTDFDIILFQSQAHYLTDQYEILSEPQRRLPAVFLEHDPPQGHPTNTRHVVDDPSMTLVHVTRFNELMWDAAKSAIEHLTARRAGSSLSEPKPDPDAGSHARFARPIQDRMSSPRQSARS
jgi:hypothetical protein